MKTIIIQRATTGERKLFNCISFKDLKDQGSKEFHVLVRAINFVLEDGTEVEDEEYFETLLNLTVLILILAKENSQFLALKMKDIAVSLTKLISMITKPETEIIDCYKTLITNMEHSGYKLNDSIQKDPLWFEGLDTKIKSKKIIMRQNAERRIKGYYYKTKDDIQQNSTPSTDFLMTSLFEQLKKDKFGGYLFVPGEKKALCVKNGVFKCQGSHDQRLCEKEHKINPFVNKENRIMFGTWNLDHQIERTRSIIPAIKEASETLPKGKIINDTYFYSLLFTTANLKLVHLVCHKKTKHKENKCRRSEYFSTPKKQLKRLK